MANRNRVKVMRGGTKIKKSELNSKDFFDKQAKHQQDFIEDLEEPLTSPVEIVD